MALYTVSTANYLTSGATSLLDGLGAITVSVWARVVNTAAERILFSAFDTALRLTANTDKSITFLAGDSYAETVLNVVNPLIWQHFVGTWAASGGNCRIYVAGENYSFDDDNANQSAWSGSTSILLGSDAISTALAGAMGHFAIWNRVLSEAEIRGMYQLRIRPNHPMLASGLLLYVPIDYNSGLTADGDGCLKNHCENQTVTALTKAGSPQYTEFSGVNYLTDPIPIGRVDYFPHGCQRIYRSDNDLDFEYQTSLNAASASISVPRQLLEANRAYYYARRLVASCGMESVNSPSCRIDIDSSGDAIGLTPNAPIRVTAEALSGGRVRIRGRYVAMGQAVSPTGVYIYMDSGSGFDFDTPAATLAAPNTLGATAAWDFSWISGSLTHGTVYRFIARAYYTAGGQSQNQNAISIAADEEGPPAVTDLTADYEVIA